MELNQITGLIVQSAIKVHRVLGPGLLESAYRACLRHELVKLGLLVEAEVPVRIVYDGLVLEVGYRMDLLVEQTVIVECTAVKKLTGIDEAQLLSHLTLGEKPAGLLINFHVYRLIDGIKRMLNGTPPHETD
jgi:GxxExxY protein